MRMPRIVQLVVCLSLVWTAPARADVVTEWNAVLEAVSPRFGGPQQQSRAQAMVQIAVHDVSTRSIRGTRATRGKARLRPAPLPTRRWLRPHVTSC